MKSNNFLLRGASGRLGNFIVRQVDGQTVISLRALAPIKKPKPVPALIRASKYAKQALRNSKIRNLYALGINKKNSSAFQVAQRDFLNPPSIDQVDLTKYDGHAGDRILVQASDDFRIKEVNLKIETHDHFLVETGLASPDVVNSGTFIYTCESENKNILFSNISIQACDYAGNIVTCRVSIAD